MSPPGIERGMNAKALAAKSLQRLDEANSRLSNDKRFYDHVQKQFGEDVE